MKFRPIHGVFLVTGLMAAVLGAQRLLDSGSRYQRVSPDPSGQVVLDVAELEPLEVRFYRFLNSGNQEVKFFVARDPQGGIQVAFDASENDFKMARGFRVDGAWIVNNKCETSIRLAEVNQHPSGCAPVPFPFRLDGNRLVLAENDILAGWRYFR